jgi:hypothetical protein
MTLQGRLSFAEIRFAFINQVTFSSLKKLAKMLFDADFKEKVIKGKSLSFIIFTDETDKPHRRESVKSLIALIDDILHPSLLTTQSKMQNSFREVLQNDFALIWECFYVMMNMDVKNPFSQTQWQALTTLLNNSVPLDADKSAYQKLKHVVNSYQVHHIANRQLKDLLKDYEESAGSSSTEAAKQPDNSLPNLDKDVSRIIIDSVRTEFEFNLKEVEWNNDLLDAFTSLCSADTSSSEQEFMQRQAKERPAVDVCLEHGSDLEKYLLVPHITFPNLPKDQLPLVVKYFKEQALVHIESIRVELLKSSMTGPSAPELERELVEPEKPMVFPEIPSAPEYDSDEESGEAQIARPKAKASKRIAVAVQGHFSPLKRQSSDDDDDNDQDSSYGKGKERGK